GDRLLITAEAPRNARLEARFCTDLRDLAGNLLDGNGDGLAGGPADRRFRVDVGNRFANGHFDCDIDGWDATAPANFDRDVADALGSPDSGSATLTALTASGEWIDQCVAVDGGGLTLEAAARSFDTGVELLSGCVYFGGADCGGATLLTRGDSAPITAGADWGFHRATFEPAPGARSALCYAGFRSDAAAEAALDRLRLTSGLFADGFESGDLSAWAGVVTAAP
ncbi:MAG: hypothetical protein AAFY88_01870, partial [Acidobacteriota bacterium]